MTIKQTNIGDKVKFKNKAEGRIFTVRSMNDKKLIAGEHHKVAVVSFSAWGIEWRGQVEKSEIEVVKEDVEEKLIQHK